MDFKLMDYKFAYKLPDGDGGEKTVYKKGSEEQAKEFAINEISMFEDIPQDQIELTLIAKGDFSMGRYYTCEGCT
ncbi:hypothetical protein [Terribacillus sp. JSM ZJ617]|uniref:hypothetical protein n=1 Tax=Terribacillus sp. JSM ZJ617 TaxID=3342119 RepID=UPI0035A8923E